MEAAAACPGGAGAGKRPEQLRDAAGRRQALAPRFVYENKITASPKVYILQPWITNLLMNYERLDASENLLAGQVLRVLRDSAAPDQPGHAVLHVSDGSYYIRVVITAEALQAEENAHMQLRLSSLVCRIIVLQKYTVCFQEEARLEDCEFYLTVQQFIVLPMERQRLETDDGNREPSVLQKIKELWLKSLAVKNAPSSEPSISQLIDAIGQNQLEVLKENAKECLDLWVPKETLVKDEVPITPWEAERKKEQGEDIFMVPATMLVIPPEEEMVVCQASTADMSEEPPGKSDDGGMVPSDLGIVSQTSSAESTAMLESSESSQDNPWNRLPPLSLTLNSSDDKAQHDLSPKVQQDMMADSNTPDLLEPCSQDSSEGLPWEEPVQTSPSLLCCYSTTSPVETGTVQAPAACAAPSPQVSVDSWTTALSLSPALPILPSSHLQSLPEEMPHRKQADSSGTAFPPDPLKHSPAPARTQGGDVVGAKRRLLAGDGQQHPHGAAQGRESDAGGSMQGAKKSRNEETGLQCRKEPSEEEKEEEQEQASSESGPSSRPERRRVLEPYVPKKPARYKYEAPSPEVCQHLRSVRISKAMLKWACWILTENEDDS
ncbi:adrenocortical dysplasia protein homolog [Porphyrio hochstetteri]